MKSIIEFLKRHAAVLLLLAVTLTMSAGTLWAKYAADVPVTKNLSLTLPAKYKYHYAAIGASGFTAKGENETQISAETVGTHNLTVFTKLNENSDPHGDLNLSGDTEAILSPYPYVLLTYMTNSTSTGNFYFKGDGTGEDNYFQNEAGNGVAGQTASNGQYVSTIAKLSDILPNSRRVDGIRVDYFGQGSTGEKFYLESVVFCSSREAAAALATQKSAGLNCTISYTAETGGTVSNPSETVGINGTAKGSTATPAAGYTFDGWYQGDAKVSDSPAYVPSKTNNAYQTVEYTAKFTQIANYSAPLNLTNFVQTEVSDGPVNGGKILRKANNVGDPNVELALDADGNTVLSKYPYVAITYMTDKDNGAHFYLRGNTPDNNAFTEEHGCSGKDSGGKYVTQIIDLNAKLGNGNRLNGIRIDYFGSGEQGDVFYLDSVVFCPTEAAANAVAAAKSAALNRTITYTATDGGTVTVGSETYGFNSTKFAGSTAQASDGYKFEGWYLGEDAVSTNAAFVPDETTSATYTAKFTPDSAENALPQGGESQQESQKNQDKEPKPESESTQDDDTKTESKQESKPESKTTENTGSSVE